MNIKKNFSLPENFFQDLSAGIVVFLVAMPLCLGIALVSGAPFFSGIIAGIVGGIIVTSISRSALGVSGPGAGLAVLVLFFIQDLGSFEAFLLAVVLAGILQIILGLFKAGTLAHYFPSSVIHGMLSGIGLIILLKQIPHIFGYDKDPEGDFSFIQVDSQNTFSEILHLSNHISFGPLCISIVSLLILILWEKKSNFKKIAKVIPGPLVAVSLGICLNLLFEKISGLSIQEDQVVQISVIQSFAGFFNLFTMPDFTQWQNHKIYIAACTLAIVASLETLLCVEATDKLDPQKRVTPTNLELIAQGIGNIISGLIGGLPVTQVIVRSSANIQSGGQTRAAAFFHGILLLISVVFLANIINLIPLASLASILFLVGYKLFNPSLFQIMYQKGWFHFVPFISTVLGITFSNLLTGIFLGLGIAIFEIIWNHYKVPFRFFPQSHDEGTKVTIQLSENISFLNKPSIIVALQSLPEFSQVTIDASNTRSIHPDVLEAIYSFQKKAETKNINITITGVGLQTNPNTIKLFKNSMNKIPIASPEKQKNT